MVQTYFLRPVRKYKIFTQPSLTQPDQTLSIREILTRFTRGIPMEGKVPVFSDEYTVDPKRLDLTEIQAELDSIRERANETMSARRKKKEEEFAAKEQERINNLVKQQLEAQAPQPPKLTQLTQTQIEGLE